MRTRVKYAVVLVTAPDIRTARSLARVALETRVAACVNVLPSIESHYWWQGRIERGREILLLLKTAIARLAALEKLILAKHPYNTPEFIVLPIHRGSQRYLDWIEQSLQQKG